MRRLRVLISAYACEPGKGSEPGVGWNVAREMSKYHVQTSHRGFSQSAAKQSPLRSEKVLRSVSGTLRQMAVLGVRLEQIGGVQIGEL